METCLDLFLSLSLSLSSEYLVLHQKSTAQKSWVFRALHFWYHLEEPAFPFGCHSEEKSGSCLECHKEEPGLLIDTKKYCWEEPGTQN